MPYSQEQKETIVERICERIAEEGKAAYIAIKEDESISRVSFYAWIDSDETLLNKYARAAEIRAEKMAYDLLQIADDQEGDVYKDPETGKEHTNHNKINRARLRVDSRKWLMSKMFPKKYGDKIQQDVNFNAPEIDMTKWK